MGSRPSQLPMRFTVARTAILVGAVVAALAMDARWWIELPVLFAAAAVVMLALLPFERKHRQGDGGT